MSRFVARLAAVLAVVTAPCTLAQLRIASWNITNYGGGREAEFQTAIYGVYQGRTMSPDVFLAQEITGSTGHNAFLALLNSAPGSPGDWAAGPYHNGRDTDYSFFYRTSKVEFVGQTVVSPGSVSENPRDIIRHDFRLVGYEGEGATFSAYNLHMKAGSGGDDQARRLIEAQKVRNDAELLPADRNFMIVGDFNIQSSSQAAYVEMTGSQANNNGRVFDPIGTPGSWNNNSTFRFVHTQDPVGGGGMDDRHDQILISADLSDTVGSHYQGAFGVPYSNSTWDDPNHSYRCWGNDGTTFNVALNTTSNGFVGNTIAQALVTSAQSSGHLPIVANFNVPAVVSSESLIDLGDVVVGEVANTTIDVSNGADTGLWTVSGVADLHYSFDPDPEVTAPVGSFISLPGAGATVHNISAVAPGLAGPFSYELRIDHDGLGVGQSSGEWVVSIVGNAVSGCLPDVTTTNANPGDAGFGVPDGSVNGSDLSYFVEQWLGGNAAVADVTTTNANPGDAGYGVPDGTVNGSDLSFFVEAWLAGCP